MRSTSRNLLALATSAALLALPSAAFAAERPDAADRDATAATTEDDDTNDGGTPNNVVDDGDNAHPSGKDRSVEHGKSGNQGKAQSDPDDDGRGPDRSNGGVDQPDGDGGVDKADQDGNNGCGNDDDFEDDNEGLCLGRNGERPSRTDARGERPSRTDARGESAARRDAEPAAKPSAKTERTSERDTGSEAARDTAQGGTAETTVTGACPATSVAVTSTKDLSNVVLVFADGDHQKFEGLSGTSDTFAGTGEHAGDTIVRVYVKSGANASGEGPGYGERHDLADCTAGAAAPTTSTTGAVGSEHEGQRPTPGTPAPSGETPAVPVATAPVETGVLGVVLERPAAPTSALPAAAGEVLAAGLDVQAVGAPATAPSGSLPRSGADALPAAAAAALALLAGTVAVRRTRVG